MHKEAAIREPLILGHKTYHDITEDVCRPIEGKAPRTWYILFGHCTNHWIVWCWLYPLPSRNRSWSLGIEQNHWMGLGYYQLRLVGRYWSRRNT
jgi:hypothetical protein